MLAGMFPYRLIVLQMGGIIYEQTSQNSTNTSPLHCSIFTMSACADSKTADTQQKNTADKSDTQQGIDIAAYKKSLPITGRITS